MNVKYRIIKKDSSSRQIVVRFFTDIVDELSLSSYRDPVTNESTNLDSGGIPLHCRTDVAIEFPIKLLTPEEETELIMRYCNHMWLANEERVINSKNNPDVELNNVVDAINNMSESVGVLNFNPIQSLQEKKDLMWIKIKAERDRRELGGYLVGQTWYHSDPQSLMKYNTLLSMAIEKSYPQATIVSAKWKDMAGSFSPMTVAKLREIRDVGVTKIAQIYSAAETHKTLMGLSEIPLTYDYTSGWPIIFGE